MGTLRYDSTTVEFDDRLLTHLQIVIVQKFRRGESFLMSWLQEDVGGGARTSIWMTPTTPVYFRFSGSRVPAVDESWLRRLAASAESSTGLVVVGEDGRPLRIASPRTLHPVRTAVRPSATRTA